jgi:hypothetical protein
MGMPRKFVCVPSRLIALLYCSVEDREWKAKYDKASELHEEQRKVLLDRLAAAEKRAMFEAARADAAALEFSKTQVSQTEAVAAHLVLECAGSFVCYCYLRHHKSELITAHLRRPVPG